MCVCVWSLLSDVLLATFDFYSVFVAARFSRREIEWRSLVANKDTKGTSHVRVYMSLAVASKRGREREGGREGGRERE